MNIVTTWMLYSLAIGAVIVLAALAAHDAQRAANRSVRWVWFSAIVLIVGLSLTAPLRRSSALFRVTTDQLTTPSSASTARRVSPSFSVAAVWSRAQSVITTPFNTLLHSSQSMLVAVPAPVHRAVAWSWILASTTTLVVFAVSYLRIRRQMQRWPVREMGEVRARVAPAAGPAVIGLAPSEIIVPAWLLHAPADEQRLVLAHESEHVRAGDPWLLVLGCAAVACMPWNPALWFALGRLRLAVELDCDRRVLRRGIPAAAYGSLLIDLSALHPTLPSAMPAFSCNGSYLERRLVAMTSRPTRFATSRRVTGALIAAVALVTACESKLPTSAEVEKMDVSAVERTLVAGAEAEYVVDGHKVTEADAKKIVADKIASVSVTNKASGKKEIYVVTTDSPQGKRAVAERAAIEQTLLDKQSGELQATNLQRDLQRVEGVRLRKTVPDSLHEVELVGRKTTELRRSFDGLLLLDGKITDATVLESLNPEKIKSIEVVKGAAAAAYADPRAAKGVIKVTLKP